MSSRVSKAAKPQKHELASDAFLEVVAARFKALGEPMRLKLVRCLFDGEQTVNQLVEACQANQANISRHLAVLAASGILGRRKEGLNAYYFIADPTIHKLCELVCQGVRQTHEMKLRELQG